MTARDQGQIQLVEEFLGEVVRDCLEAQPWWRKYANTVTTAVAGLVGLATWVAMFNADLPSWVTAVVGFVLFVGNVLGVRFTRNGITKSTVSSIQSVVAAAPAPTGRHARRDGSG